MTTNRIEVMQYLSDKVQSFVEEYLRPVEKMWQPADLLPDSRNPDFFEEVRDIKESCRELPYDYMAVLVGDTITEEALPTYEAWLMTVEGVNQQEPGGWTKWIRAWTAEENRHGDLLNKYLYLSGRVDMKAMEISTQHLIADGFDIGTGTDPYRNFIYTSFQELATNISHRRTATLAKTHGNQNLSKICGVIAADEMRHHKAYKRFVEEIYKIDPSGMMVAFEDMMRRKIVMPAHLLKESGSEALSNTFAHFSDAAQRIGVYTTIDYINILESLIVDWKIEGMSDLNDAAEKARDYLMKLPDRLKRIADRVSIPETQYEFSWVTR